MTDTGRWPLSAARHLGRVDSKTLHGATLGCVAKISLQGCEGVRMMKKAECEQAIRSMCHKWRRLEDIASISDDQLSVTAFIAWVRQNHPAYLDFRTSTSVEEDVELWFDQEFRQAWRR